jgi:hypothetical protein
MEAASLINFQYKYTEYFLKQYAKYLKDYKLYSYKKCKDNITNILDRMIEDGKILKSKKLLDELNNYCVYIYFNKVNLSDILDKIEFRVKQNFNDLNNDDLDYNLKKNYLMMENYFEYMDEMFVNKIKK